jgi:hypothetical protein
LVLRLRESLERRERARSGKEFQVATLSDLGVTKTESKRWQAEAEAERLSSSTTVKLFHAGRMLADMTTHWSKQHPDLDPESGDVKWQSYLYTDPGERRFMQMWNDDAERDAFMARVEARQREEHPDVQRWVGGQTYGQNESPYQGYRRYLDVVQYARGQVAATEGGTTIVHGDDVANMSNAEYERHFDEHGRPRPGVIYRATSRDVPIDDGADATSQAEWRRHQARS